MPYNTPEKRQAYRAKRRVIHAAEERKRRLSYGNIIRAHLRERYATEPEYRERRVQLAKAFYAKTHPKDLASQFLTPEERQERRRLMHQRIGKTWYQRNRNQKRVSAHAWYEAHRDIVKQRSQLWRMQHPAAYAESQRLCRQRRRTALLQADFGIHREQWEAIKKVYKNRCAYCSSKQPLGMDHVIPLSKGGTHTPDNIVPACRFCNSRKHANPPLLLPAVRLLL